MKHLLLPGMLLAATITHAQSGADQALTADALEATAINDLAALSWT